MMLLRIRGLSYTRLLLTKGYLESATAHNGRICVAMMGSLTVETFDPNNSAAGFSLVCSLSFVVRKGVQLVIHDDRLTCIGHHGMRVYDSCADQWTDAYQSEFGDHESSSTVECDSRLICSGGFSNDMEDGVMMLYGGVWSKLPSLKNRFNHSMVIFEDVVYAIGGGYDAARSVEMLRIKK